MWSGAHLRTPSKHVFETGVVLRPREYERIRKRIAEGLPGMTLTGRSGKSRAPIAVRVELDGWSVFASKTLGHFHGYCHKAVSFSHYIRALKILAKYGLIDADWVRLVGDRRVALLARSVPQ